MYFPLAIPFNGRVHSKIAGQRAERHALTNERLLERCRQEAPVRVESVDDVLLEGQARNAYGGREEVSLHLDGLDNCFIIAQILFSADSENPIGTATKLQLFF